MSTTQSSADELYGPVEVRVAGSKFRDEYAAVKTPDYADWMLDECPYFKTGTPLIPLPCVAVFRDWARERNYTTCASKGASGSV